MTATGAAIGRGVTLLRRLGCREGDRLAVQLGDDLSTFGVLAAACLEGVVAVPLPADLVPSERRTIVDDADPTALVVDPAAVRHPPTDVDVSVHSITTSDLAALPATDPSADRPRTRPMAYTSGTTGRRKGVDAGVHGPTWGEVTITDEHEAFGGRHGDHHLVVSPLYHSGPFRHALVTALLGGEVVVLGGFEAERWRDALRQHRPTSLFCVPTQLHRLLSLPATTADDLASLELLLHAGAPCPVPLKRRVLELAPTGSVWEFYGSTEGQFTVCPPDTWKAAPGTVGTARRGRDLEIRRDDGTPAGTDEIGTVWCHVPDHARFTYWRDPVRTAEAWDGDAFTVGDLGSMDHAGRLTLAGRPGDLVISGGVNVYPAEVERCLLDLDGVAEAVVFGLPDEDWGERLVAAVVPHDGMSLDPEHLRRSTRERLRAAAVPKTIAIVDDLPRTATGKVRRVGLAQAIVGTWTDT